MIDKYSLGNIIVNGTTYKDDIKIIQGKVVSPWWRNRGHKVELNDIKDIIEAKPGVLVLGKGQPGLMKSTRSLREFLQKNDVDLIEEKTSKAVKTFNRLFIEGKNVCAGFHLSC